MVNPALLVLLALKCENTTTNIVLEGVCAEYGKSL